MAERAHPDEPGFKDRWAPFWFLGFIPMIRRARSPYREALFWRYQWASAFCQDKDVVDVPCGMGWGSSLLEGARSVVGIDLDTSAIAEAQKRYGDAVRFQVGDMAALPLTAGSADVICCLEGIEHVPPSVGESFLADCHRVLREQGRLFLSSPYLTSGASSGNPYHVHEYQPSEIKSLVQRWFMIEEEITREVEILKVLYLRCRRKPL